MELIEQRLGNYRLNRLIGTGAFADIYLSTHIYLNSQVAIKVPRGPFDAHALDSFLTEARLLINLVHAHIIRIIDFGIEDGTPFLVMDYAPGGNLRQLHPPDTVVPLSTVVTYVKAIASALQYAHRQHLIHRDLKPENILLGPTRELLLSDFGLALFFPDGDPAQVQERFGTLEYMAPELIRGQALPASDQYALAVMVYEWLSGKRPFGGTHAELIHQHLYSPPASLCEQHPELSPAIEEALFKALSKDPALRFVDVLSFASAFEEACHTSERLPSASRVDAALLIKDEQGRYDNLPRPLTQLLGREQELAAARDLLLQPDVQLLTLTGTPGVGKTRLALALGADVQQTFTHGLCFVSLAAVSDPDLVGSAIQHALGLPENANRSPIDQLKAFLRDKQLLLLLDNFEQVLAAAPLLVALLSACQELKILVTSRVVLHLEGEQQYPVPPLAVPDVQHLPPMEILAQVASVALFVQRARATLPAFALTAENAADIAELCVRMDGVPLELVLAAARIKLLSPQALLARLRHRFEVLKGHRQDASVHQQTLRATIDWSYHLLSSEEQTIFRRLCVFVGGFTLEAAEAVCTFAGKSTTPALEKIASLVDHSLLLLREEDGGERRLELLAMIREYGLELLIDASELERARDAHAAYYLALAERAEPALYGPEQAQWAEQLKRDFENIRAAIQWLHLRYENEQALRLVTALLQFWLLHGSVREARHFLAQALEASGDASAEQDTSLAQVRASALYAAGYLAFHQNDPGQATALLEESERLSRKLQDKRGIALALSYLGLFARNRGEVEAARVMHEEALALSREVGVTRDLAELLVLVGATELQHGAYAQAREYFEESLVMMKGLGDVWGTAVVLFYVGWAVYEQRAYAQARMLLEDSLAQFRTLGTPDNFAEALIVYAYTLVALGDEVTARTALEEALSLSRELENQDDSARALCGLGHLALRQGDLARARTNFEESITLLQRRWLIPRVKWALASSLEGLGEIALAEGQVSWTVRLYASADTVRAAHGYYSPLLLDQPYYDHTLDAARSQLGEKAYAAAWTEGQAMTPQEVIAAEADTQPLEGDHPASLARLLPARAPTLLDELTAREVEVLRLLAQGLSNKQIAERLDLSPHTVNKHTRSIYGKLCVNSRSAATRYALEHHLH